MSALVMVDYTANVLQKLIFWLNILCYHIADADIESLKSLHILFDKYLDHMLVKFEQNHIVQSIQNFELFDENDIPFWQSIDAIL